MKRVIVVSLAALMTILNLKVSLNGINVIYAVDYTNCENKSLMIENKLKNYEQ